LFTGATVRTQHGVDPVRTKRVANRQRRVLEVARRVGDHPEATHHRL
jgi:hypothetical protein